MRIESWVYDILFFAFAWLMLLEGRKIYGREKASIFLWGSLLWTGIIENLMTMTGGYDYFAYANYYYAGENLIKGYVGWFSWMLFVPVAACIGWFLLSFPAFMISTQLLKNKGIWLRSALAGIMLVSWDMYFDPMAVVNEWWRWTSPGVYYRGVPISNWIGWFFLLFFFGAIYDRTVIQLKGFRWLNKIEKLIFRADTSDLSGWDVWRVGRVFYFRLIAFLPVFYICVAIVVTITTGLWNNRWVPYGNVFPNSTYMKYYSTPPEGVVQKQVVPKDRIMPKPLKRSTGGER